MTEVEATVSAAYIQGWFSFFGTVLAFIGLIASIWLGAYFGLRGYKSDKLAEAKRDAYLDLVVDWQSFLMDLGSYPSVEIKETYLLKFQMSLAKVLGSLHKASFISDPLTKEKILEFAMQLSKSSLKYREYIDCWYSLPKGSKEKNNIILDFLDYVVPIGLDAMELQISLRNELGLKEDEAVNQRILNRQKEFTKETRDKLQSILGVQ